MHSPRSKFYSERGCSFSIIYGRCLECSEDSRLCIRCLVGCAICRCSNSPAPSPADIQRCLCPCLRATEQNAAARGLFRGIGWRSSVSRSSLARPLESGRPALPVPIAGVRAICSAVRLIATEGTCRSFFGGIEETRVAFPTSPLHIQPHLLHLKSFQFSKITFDWE